MVERSYIGYGRGEAGEYCFYAQDAASSMRLPHAFQRATQADVERAAQLAAAAAPAYAALGGARHAAFLRQIAEQLATQEARLVELVPLETGLAPARVRNELARTVAQLHMFADLAEDGSWVDARIEHGDALRTSGPKPDTRSMLQAIGPVAVFGASNFPLAFSVAGGDTASALAAGCPVVVKAHPAHPLTSALVAAVIVEAAQMLGLPEGVFSLLFDDGISVGQALVRHPAIGAVGFTGSLRAGRALMDIAAARTQPIPVYAEMGSVNPVVVLPQSLAKRGDMLANLLAGAVVLGNGQFCTCPGLILAIDSPALDRLRDDLVERLAATPPMPMLTTGIAAAFRDGVATAAACEGVHQVPAPTNEGHAVGPVLLETSAAALLGEPALRHEIFGPAALLVRCTDETQLLTVLATLDGQLTATVHAEVAELEAWPMLLPLLTRKAGRVLFGGVPTGVEVGPAMVHGGPYPASSDSRSTSVGTAAILRFARPVCYQNWPDHLLPAALQTANPLRLWRMVDGVRCAP